MSIITPGNTATALIERLLARGPAADQADKLALYGRFVGDWEMDAVRHRSDGSRATGKGEIHFGWALAGRAIIDVWLLPGSFHGTTLRVYDPALDAWHIVWSDPVKQLHVRQIGRARGRDIVQESVDEGSAATRWSFTKITDGSFHWLGERSCDGGASWALEVEFYARRLSA